MSDIEPEIPTNNNKPTSIKLLIHMFFYLLRYLLLIGSMDNRMVDYMFSLTLSFLIHFRIFYLNSPFLLFLLQACWHYAFLNVNVLIIIYASYICINIILWR